MSFLQNTFCPAASTPAAVSPRSMARTTRCDESSGTWPAPSPSTSTRRPDSVVWTSISSYRLSASPRLSNPGPRFALDAATTALAARPAGRIRVTVTLPAPRVRGPLPAPRVRANPPLRQPELGHHRDGVHRHGLDDGYALQRSVRILEAVARDGAHHGGAPRHPAVLDRLQQTRDAGRRRRLDEHPSERATR